MNLPVESIKKPETREDWLALRKTGLGGSDVAAIIPDPRPSPERNKTGVLSPWRTPYDVFADKTGRKADEPPTEAMRIGTALEDTVARRYAEQTGREVRNFNFMLRAGHLLGDIDRLVIPEGAKIAAIGGDPRTDRILECKTSSEFATWGGVIPVHYLAQVQTYMGLAGAESADVAALFLVAKHFEVIEARFDEEAFTDIRLRVEEFWSRYVATNTPPPPTMERDARAIWARSNPGKKVYADADTRHAVSELVAATAAVEIAEAKESEARTAVMALMGDAKEMIDEETGKRLLTWKSNKDSESTDWATAAAAMRAHIPADTFDGIVKAATTTKPGARVLRLARAK